VDIITSELIRSQVGKTAKFRQLDREIKTPLNFILDEAEKQSSTRFNVFWLDEGIPEHFSLLASPNSSIVFSSHFIEITAYIRSLTRSAFSKEIREELTERICLRLIAHFSLNYGNIDLAVSAFIKSVMGQSIYIPIYDTLKDIEYSPINESYMIPWFYGIIHEIGHIHAKEISNLLSDEDLANEFEIALSHFSAYPEELKKRAREKLYSEDSVISIDHLRQEVISDIFATSVLLQGTINIMRELGSQFKFDNFIAETIVMMNILAVFQKCKETARLSPDQDPNYDTAEEVMGFAPISFVVRSQRVLWYLENCFFPSGYDENNTGAAHNINTHHQKLIDLISSGLKDIVQNIDTGMSKAMRFVLFPHERDDKLEANFFNEGSEDSSVFGSLEIKKFCELAESLGLVNEKIQQMRVMVNLDPIELHYVVPWVKGSHGRSHPVGLDTKYGYLVFIFQTQGQLYKKFFEISTENLSSNLRLETAMLVFHSTEKIKEELSLTMPSNKQYTFVFEGTKQFRILMEELVNDTIWA
jgi:hypothetical protein